MSLPNGKRLGPYEIVSRIGAGGMGEVFRARDTRLDRTVAVKTLPTELAANAQLRMRLQREAKAISALTHPNICALYDVGEQDGVHYLVMEHLDGETLADRLERGPLPLREALRHGIEIANALERAHREGVIHRDLKPGNVMLTKSGAKLLDFGLAKSVLEDPVSADAPTLHAAKQPLTAEGTIVGTFQYMSPEQLEAAPVDARTDIFAFGAMLYEMVTGRRAFEGKTRTSLIAAIVASNPRPMSELQPVTPGALEHVVARCLEKDPDARWQSAHDVRLELEYIARQLDAPAARPKRASALPWIVAAIAALLAAGAAFFAFRANRQTPAPPVHAQILAPRGHVFLSAVESLSISPDARYLTFRTDDDNRLWLRPVGTNDAKPLEGTEGAILPIWSPDSRWICFTAQGKLKKVSIAGGPPVTICDADKGRPGAWSRDGVILFSPTSVSTISRVSADGGTPQPLTKFVSGETTHRWATFLPDGNHFLYLAATHAEGGNVDGAVYAASLDEPEKRTLVVRTRSNVAYARGHLLYVRGRHLLAQPFDARALKLTGEPFTVATSVDSNLAYFRSTFAVADDGTLLYQLGRRGEETLLMSHEPPAQPVEIMRPQLDITLIRLSPDKRALIGRATDAETGLHDLWVFDLEQKTKQRLTATPKLSEWDVVWSADGTKIALSRNEGFGSTGAEILIKTIDGSEPDRLVMPKTSQNVLLDDWSRDGRYLSYHVTEPGKDFSGDVFVLPVEPGAKPIPIATGPAAECCSSFSPDGKWLVYMSNETGRMEPYAIAFPPAAPPISIGTAFMRWTPAGEMYVVTNDTINVAPVTIRGNLLTVGAPRPGPPAPEGLVSGESDGKRWIYAGTKPDPQTDSLTLLTGWVRSPERPK